VARHLLSSWINRGTSSFFPSGTLVVNLAGSLALGFLFGFWYAGDGAPGLAWALLGVGFLGSFTTVSSWSLQTLYLSEEGRNRAAAFNVIATLGGCLALAWLGLLLGVWLG
jgi:fluoride exporter